MSSEDMNLKRIRNDSWKKKSSFFAIIKNVLLLIIVIILINKLLN